MTQDAQTNTILHTIRGHLFAEQRPRIDALLDQLLRAHQEILASQTQQLAVVTAERDNAVQFLGGRTKEEYDRAEAAEALLLLRTTERDKLRDELARRHESANQQRSSTASND